MLKPILVLFASILCWHNALAGAPSLQQVNSLRSAFEGIIAGANYQHQYNFCRTIKNLGKDAVSCDIYQTFNTAGQPHSEEAYYLMLGGSQVLCRTIYKTTKQTIVN